MANSNNLHLDLDCEEVLALLNYIAIALHFLAVQAGGPGILFGL
jgi:hypothetical protein